MRRNKGERELLNEDGSYVVKTSKKFNILAFILCVIVSFFVWVYVMNTQNSNYTQTFNVAIEVINEDKLLTKTGMSVFGVPKKNASITIQGIKTEVQKYSEKDFRAYVDASDIKGRGNVSASIRVETPSTSLSVISVDLKNINVYVDEKATCILTVTPYTDSGNYILSANVSEIKVSGPKTYIEKINSARVYIPGSYFDVGYEKASTDIRLYNSESNQISQTQMSYMKIDVPEITVRVEGVIENPKGKANYN